MQRIDEKLVSDFPLGGNDNPRSGNWLAASFREFSEIADYMNSARVAIHPDKIVFAKNRFFVLFLVDSSAKVYVKKTKKKGK